MASSTNRSRPPRSLRRRVAECLRRATCVEIGAIAFSADGTIQSSPVDPAIPRSLPVYHWQAQLPDGRSVSTLMLFRPVSVADEPFFPALVESLADAIHRGVPFGGIQAGETAEGTIATAVDGAPGVVRVLRHFTNAATFAAGVNRVAAGVAR